MMKNGHINGLDGIDISECTFALPLWDMTQIMFTILISGGNFFCPPMFGWRDSSSSSL